MTKSKGIRKKYNIGDIITRPNGTQWRVGEDRKWIYIKKPREEWKTPLPKPKKKLEYNYPPLRIPENMRETQYSGYYITEDGKAYREPGKYDRNGHYGKINEYGLIYLKPAYRGHPGYPEHQYECINISVRDENGKFLKQIKKSIHQLVAEVFVPNPEGHTEILHLDDNNWNNHYTNLKWGTHKENMEATGLPEGSIRKAKGNSSNYIKKDCDWVLIPSTRPPWNKGLKGVSWNTLPDGTIRTRADGTTWIKQNGEWVYQKKKKEMINTLHKKKFSYIKNGYRIQDMQKNSAENFTTVEIDPVSGEYIINIPEWICDEKGWYEGTEVNIEVENDCIIIKDLEET